MMTSLLDNLEYDIKYDLDDKEEKIPRIRAGIWIHRGEGRHVVQKIRAKTSSVVERVIVDERLPRR